MTPSSGDDDDIPSSSNTTTPPMEMNKERTATTTSTDVDKASNQPVPSVTTTDSTAATTSFIADSSTKSIPSSSKETSSADVVEPPQGATIIGVTGGGNDIDMNGNDVVVTDTKESSFVGFSGDTNNNTAAISGGIKNDGSLKPSLSSGSGGKSSHGDGSTGTNATGSGGGEKKSSSLIIKLSLKRTKPRTTPAPAPAPAVSDTNEKKKDTTMSSTEKKEKKEGGNDGAEKNNDDSGVMNMDIVKEEEKDKKTVTSEKESTTATTAVVANDTKPTSVPKEEGQTIESNANTDKQSSNNSMDEEMDDSKSLDDTRLLSEVITSGKASSIDGPNATSTSGGSDDVGNTSSTKDAKQKSLSSTTTTAVRNSSVLTNQSASTSTAATSLTNSFLDALSEDQRRVRTRHLPGATGFRKLHKSEIKRDLSLVKAMLRQAKQGGNVTGVSGGGIVGAGKIVLEDEPTPLGLGDLASSSLRADVESSMDVEDKSSLQVGSGEESPSDEESTTTASSRISNSSRFGLGGGGEETSIRQSAFALPRKETNVICSESEDKSSALSNQNNTKGSSTSSKHSEKDLLTFIKSPQVVQQIVGFNPPRPAESVGPKKVNRLQRWERNPQDVEGDMNTYRKTVERTRQELHKTELERERVEVIGCHARNHYVRQLHAVKDEIGLLDESLNATQIEGVKAAELLTSKTRSRGVGRGGTHAMRDVISILKSRGEKLDSSNDLVDSVMGVDNWCAPGIGGICTSGNDTTLARGWILPGNKVTSPYGKGVVTKVFGPSELDVSTPGDGGSSKKSKEKSSETETKALEKLHNTNGTTVILPPRVSVRLAFGIGYFIPDVLEVNENPAAYSDTQLSKRWKGMFETAKLMGECLDTKTLESSLTANDRKVLKRKFNTGINSFQDETASAPNGDVNMIDENGQSTSPTDDPKQQNLKNIVGKVVSVGAGLLPTPCTSGGGMDQLSLNKMEKSIEEMQKFRTGVLGRHSNPAVPQNYKEWEKQRNEMKILKGTVLQLRNKVSRQRRFRILNERNAALSRERRSRFEVLLFEMKADLNSLKERLGEELDELGIDEDQAENLLKDYYANENEDYEMPEEDEEDTDDVADSKKRKSDELGEKTSRRKLEILA